MKKRTKFSILFIIILFLLILITFLYAGKWTKDVQKFLETSSSIEHAKVHDVVVTETKDGVKNWEIYAAIGEYDATTQNTILTDIVGNYYENSEVVMSFTAPKGTYNAEKKEVALTDGVRVVGKDKIELTANKIYWITTEDKINAEGDVIVNKADEIISLSNRGTTTTDLKSFEIMDNAEIRVYNGNIDKGVLDEKF